VSLDAEVTMRFRIKDVCDESDCRRNGVTFNRIVRDLVESENIMGLAEDEGVIVKVRKIRRTP
jgi:hypothetical protein